jgi:electron transport complex protein RnfG
MREMMKELGKPAFVLFLVSVVVVMLLAFTDHLTAPVIAARTAADLNAAKQSVLPAAQTFVELKLPEGLTKESEGLSTVHSAWVAQDATGTTVGTVVSLASKGYAGPVGFTVGIDLTGKVTGVKAGTHKETPGLGDKVILSTSKVMKQLVGMVPTAALKVVKGNPGANEIDAISGSTITSRAAVRAVSGAWELSTRLNAEGAWK